MERVVSLTLMLSGIGTALFIIPSQVLDPSPLIPNAKTFPHVLTWIFVGLCGLWAIDTFRHRETPIPSDTMELVMGMGIGLFFVILFIFINEAGYMLGGTLSVATVIIFINGWKRWPVAIFSGAIITLAYAAFFGKLLHIDIPAGLLQLF